MAKPWPRDAYARAVWDSDLDPRPRLVALAFADHARSGDVAYVTYERLLAVTGMRSRSTVATAMRILVETGWLVLVEKGRQHRASRYRLTVPSGTERVPLNRAQQSNSAHPAVQIGPSSGTERVPDYSEDCSEDDAGASADHDDLEALLRRVGREAS